MSLYLGRLPGRVPVGLHELGYYSAGPLPKGPASVPVPGVTAWGMLGNDTHSDCGVAGLEHGMEAAANITFETETWPTDDQAVAYYLTYTGGQDDGVVLADYLKYVRGHTYYGKTIAAYAPVSVADVPTLQTAVWLYGFAYTGIVVYNGMMSAFQANQASCVWDTTMLDSREGGHCVPVVGYDDLYLYLVTWGQIVRMTYSCWHAVAEEAWAVLTGELVARHGDGRGINISVLQGDLGRLAA